MSQSLLSPHPTRKHTGVRTLPRTACETGRQEGTAGITPDLYVAIWGIFLGNLASSWHPAASASLTLRNHLLSSSVRPVRGQRRAFPWNRRGRSPLLNLLSVCGHCTTCCADRLSGGHRCVTCLPKRAQVPLSDCEEPSRCAQERA